MNIEINDLKAAIEAILFTMGEAVSGGRMAEALGIDQKTFNDCMEQLQKDYESESRGIRLFFLDGAWQLGTKKEYYNTLVRIAHVPKKQALTDVLMETLAIIAYRQPVTKQEIEKIRGVKSDHAVNKLIEYGLVCEAGRLDAPGRPIMLATTEEFLRRFGVEKLEELPEPAPEQMADFREEARKQVDALSNQGDDLSVDVQDFAMQIEGIDYEQGLSFFAGDKQQYLIVMKSVAEEGEKLAAQLCSELAQKDFQSYTIHAHALKGITANIGAEHFSGVAKQLELAGKEGRYEDIFAQHDQALDEFYNLLDGMKALLKAELPKEDKIPDENKPKISDGQMEILLLKIQKDLEDFYREQAMETIEECMGYRLDDKLAEGLREIQEAVAGYEYEEPARKAADLAAYIRHADPEEL